VRRPVLVAERRRADELSLIDDPEERRVVGEERARALASALATVVPESRSPFFPARTNPRTSCSSSC
jgi:hypothetical protein